MFYLWKVVYSGRLVNPKRKHKKRRKKVMTEIEKADIVIDKIMKGLETTDEDRQVFVNNSEYIERKLKELAKK